MPESDDGRVGDDWLDLADAIELLREQVAEAQRRGRYSDIRFGLSEVTVEFGMELSRSSGRSGGLRFALAGVEGKKDDSRNTTHHVTLKLRPMQGGVEGVEMDDEDGV